MRRVHAAAAIVATVALGLASRRLHLGVFVWDKSLGDALYAVMLYFVFALARPSLAPRTLGALAFGASFAIELFQLTGVPLRLPWLLQRVLGVEFAWHDVACYAVGATCVAAGHDLVRRRRRSPSGAG